MAAEKHTHHVAGEHDRREHQPSNVNMMLDGLMGVDMVEQGKWNSNIMQLS